MTATFSGAAQVAGVVGAPVRQSLSPLIHNAWIAAAGLDAVYVPFSPAPERFEAFVDAQRGGALLGLNVTLPFKERALRCADRADAAAQAAGAANLLLFQSDGVVEALNRDGEGLLAAFTEQSPTWRASGALVALIGAGGAARGAAAALGAAGARVMVLNRSPERAEALARSLPGVEIRPWAARAEVLGEVSVIVNATSAGLEGSATLDLPLEIVRSQTVVMDMVYKPLRTSLLQRAAMLGLPVVDGLAMLIGQARPSFQALYGRPAPDTVDVRALALRALGEAV